MSKQKRSPVELYNKMMEPEDNVELIINKKGETKKKLVQCGSLAVDVILSQLFALRKSKGEIPIIDVSGRGYAIMCLLDIVERESKPCHAASIASMLTWPEIFKHSLISYFGLLGAVREFNIRHLLPYLDVLQFHVDALERDDNKWSVENAVGDRLDKIIEDCEALRRR